MSSVGDEVAAGTIAGMIFGFPIFIGIFILAIPFVIISCITGIPMGTLMLNLLIFLIAAFLVWLFSKYQIIENGIVGLIVGSVIHTHFGWHPIACILIGAAAVGFLFFISNTDIGFWIKTILFSTAVSLMVFVVLYSDAGLFPLPDMIWKIAFAIIFFLENIFIRCSVAYNSSGFLSGGNRNPQTVIHYDVRQNQRGAITAPAGHNEGPANNSTIAEINDFVRKMNAEIREKQKEEETKDKAPKDYLHDRVYLFSKQENYLDSRAEEIIYQTLQLFIDDAYTIIPHVAFREVFRWGDWKSDQILTDRITKMHFDFGIYNKELQPIFFLEIHGKKHKEDPATKERDRFKEEVMKRCGMKLITIDCSEPMADSEIREKAVARIKEEIPDRTAYPVYCPKCRSLGKNNLMELKNRKDNKNEHFYGCSTYGKKKDNCSGLNIEDVPPLYYGIPLFKDEN